MERTEYEGTYPNKYNIYTSDFNQPNYDDSYNYDNYNYDNEEKSRYTVILKVTLDDNIFICNRNSDDYNNVFNDKYVKWWESNLVDIMKFTTIDNCEILEFLYDYDNYNKRHQKLINPIKEKYIEQFNAKSLDDNALSNVLFNNIKNNYRTKYKIQYNDFKLVMDKLGHDIYSLLYENAKKLFFNKSERYFLTLSRERIWNIQTRSLETKVCYIILRDYIKYMIDHESKIPFNKEIRKINDTLDMLIKVNDLSEKKKIRNLIEEELYDEQY